jgi:hypothetical protein
VHGLSDEAVTRNDGAIRAQPGLDPMWSRCPYLAQIGAVPGLEVLAGAKEIQPAQLEAVPKLPDAVKDRAMALVLGRQGIFAAEIRGRS